VASLSQPQRTLVLDILRFDRLISIPKIEDGSHHDTNTQTAKKEPTIGREPDEQDKYQRRCNNQTYTASKKSCRHTVLRIPFHNRNILSLCRLTLRSLR
jgi:hypothetical protein